MTPNDILSDIQRANREGWILSLNYDAVALEHIAILTRHAPSEDEVFTSGVLVTRARTAKGSIAKVLQEWADL